MSGLNGPSYQGPPLGNQVNTKAEVEQGQVARPAGTVPVVVEPGDNLSAIAQKYGTTVQQLLKDNPQYSLNPGAHPGTRDASLIYPGEAVFVRPAQGSPAATKAAALDVQQAESQKVNSDSQETNKEDNVAHAEANLERSVRAQIAAGGDPAQIAAQLKNDPDLKGIPDKDIDRIVNDAKTPASPTHPVGGDRASAPLSPEYKTAQAVKQWSDTQHAENDTQVTHHQQATQSVIAAVKYELAHGGDINEIKSRFGNDPALNKGIDQAAGK